MSSETITRTLPRVGRVPNRSRKPSGPKLPVADCGQGPVTYRNHEDRLVTVLREDVQRSILTTLVPQPLAKWGLRDALHLPDAVLFRELTFLRDQGRVKLIGYRRVNTWALAGWHPPAATPTPRRPRPMPDTRPVILAPKPAPVADSWWTRPEFRHAGKEA